MEYEYKIVKTIRGTESRSITKWENQGWEVVSQSQGRLQSEIKFRRVKPKSLVAYLRGAVAKTRNSFAGLSATGKRNVLILAGGLVVILIAIIAVTSLAGGNDDDGDQSGIAMPGASKDFEGEDHQDVVGTLTAAGFTNIETRGLDDLITGWLTKDGSVASIEVDGQTTFSADDRFAPDVRILVSHHSFPPEPSESPEPSDDATRDDAVIATVTDISVDDLLAKLNASDLGGSKTGDKFRVTGELFESDAWMTGVNGEFTVFLKAQGGADDLMVFVNESDAAGWQDGTQVEMVVEIVEATINGETTSGWLRAEAVTVISGGTTADAKAEAANQTFLDEVAAYAAAGAGAIDGIEPGSADGVLNVNLNIAVAQMQKLELQAAIQTINRNIVDLAEANDAGRPTVRFYLAGDVVAENRPILDPWDVKFKGILDD